MTISVKHAKVVAVQDSGDGKVSSNAWNDDHTLQCATGVVLGRQSSGTGTVEEIPIASISSASWKVADRTALSQFGTTNAAVFLEESGREGIFVWSSANLSTQVSADTQQGIYVAPASDTTGTTGAWVRQYDGRIKARWFGLAADGVTDDSAKILSAVALANALAGSNLTGYGIAVPSIELPFTPSGICMGSTTISLTKAIAIHGETGGTIGGAATWLIWTGDCNGIETHVANCYFDGIGLKGSWTSGTPTEGEYHAIKGYYKFGYGRIYIDSWRGDGIHVNITAGSGGDTEGNCNGIYGHVAAILNCRKGVSMEGSDANAGRFDFIDVNYCRQAGVYEASGLGNSYGAVQTAGNGVTGHGTPCICYNNGHFYTVASGQATNASTNSPPSTATSNTYWIYWKDAAAATTYAPQWTSGLTWREGGSFHTPTSQSSNGSQVDYLYKETDQPPAQTAQEVLIKGTNSSNTAPNTRYIGATANGVEFGPSAYSRGQVTIAVPSSTTAMLVDGTVNGVDPVIELKSGNVQTKINWTVPGFLGASIFKNHSTQGLYFDNYSASAAFYWRGPSSASFAQLDATGLSLSSGLVYKINGTQVVGSQQAAIADDASGAANQATVNAVLAALRAHGLIAT